MTEVTSTRSDGFSPQFERFAGWAAAGAALAGAAYALAFVALKIGWLTGLTLMLAPLLATPPLVAVYGRLRAVDSGFALVALVLGLWGGLGAFVHGGFDLATALHPPDANSDFPHYVDPRGLLTFGASGLALIVFAWLAGRAADVPSWVRPGGLVLGLVLIATWLGRMIVLDATSALVLGPALVAGVLSPLFYLGLARWLLSQRT
jgi:hypothetical protein